MKLPDKARLFDALFDENEFAAALDDIAEAIGARSYVGGFAFHDGSRALDIANDYYAPEQLEDFYTNYFDQDPWGRAVVENWKPGIMADPGERLTPRQIEWSGLYQGFIRPLGDDLFYALAVTAESTQGIGSIGFHRGRGSSGFSDRAKAALTSVTPDLARVVALRGRLQGMERDIMARSSMLDAMEDGMIMLDARGRIVMANAAAEARLRSGGLIGIDKGRLSCRCPRHRKQLGDVLASLEVVRHSALRLDDGAGESLDLSFLALPAAGGRARNLVAFPAAPQPTRADTMRQLYGLSSSEADIAIMLADGLDPADIAERRGTSLNTVRAQLRAVGEKLDCSRLIDIVRRVAALPRLGNPPSA